MALKYGWAVTPIQKYDYSYNCMMKEPKILNNIDRVLPFLNECRYCLSSDNHMIGVLDGVVLDTSNRFESYMNFPYNAIYLFSWIAG